MAFLFTAEHMALVVGPSVVLIKRNPARGRHQAGPRASAGHLVNEPRACVPRPGLALLHVLCAAAAPRCRSFQEKRAQRPSCPDAWLSTGRSGEGCVALPSGPSARPLQFNPRGHAGSHGVGRCTSRVRVGVVTESQLGPPVPLWLQAHSPPCSQSREMVRRCPWGLPVGR